MQLVKFVDVEGRMCLVNPEHVVFVRDVKRRSEEDTDASSLTGIFMLSENQTFVALPVGAVFDLLLGEE